MSFKNPRGQALVYAALFSLLMFWFVGLAIDTAWLTYVRNQAQARVDSAALAGATAISDGESAVDSRAKTFSDQNMVIGPAVDPENIMQPVLYDPGNPACNSRGICTDGITYANCNGISVANSVTTPIFFSRLINSGVPTTNINVIATAIVGYQPNFPLALLDCQVQNPGAGTCAPVTLRGFTSPSPSPSDDSAITGFFDVPDARTCRDLVENPATVAPCLVPNASGRITVNNGVLGSCLQAMRNKFNEPPPGPWKVVVPVISCDDLRGSAANPTQTAKVVRLTRLQITNVVATGSDKRIEGEICGGGLQAFPACTRLVQ